jgi:cytochrome c553
MSESKKFMKTLFALINTALALFCLTWSVLSHAEMPAKAGSCIGCHGPNGNSTMPGIPSLAAQNSRYIYLQLRDFQEGRRSNDMMTPMVAGLSKDDMREIADYYSKQKLSSKGFKADEAKAKLGKAKADETLCAMCHLGEFVGQNEIPKVAGQNYDYVVKTLTDFKAKTRTNDAGNMTSVASTLSAADIENLAHYIAGLN